MAAAAGAAGANVPIDIAVLEEKMGKIMAIVTEVFEKKLNFKLPEFVYWYRLHHGLRETFFVNVRAHAVAARA
jgi:hypothetical protein